MPVEEITGVIIDSRCVTNDTGRIDAALIAGRRVEYVSRGQAQLLSLRDNRAEWGVLARAPALFVIVDGVRFRRTLTDSLLSFYVSAPPATVENNAIRA